MANETFTVTETIVLAPGGVTDGDGVIDPGETVRITVHITNNSNGVGATTATGLEFLQILNGMTLLAQAGNDVNVSPIAFNDTYNAVGNTLLEVGSATGQTGPQASVAGHVTDNDLEFFGDTFTISAVQAQTSIVGNVITATTSAGGTVSMVVSGTDMGSFTYMSAVNFTGGADTFTYTIRDSGLDGTAGTSDDLVSTATVTINVSNQVWYVDTGFVGVSNGTSTNPFTSLASVSGGADTDDAGDTIYFVGSETTNAVLETGQQLVGSGTALVVGGYTLATAGPQATLNHAGVGVTLASGNTVTGLNIVGTAGAGIAIADGGGTVGTLTVANVGISGQGGIIDIDQGGTLAVTLNSAVSSGSTGANGGVIDLGGTGTLTGTFTVTGATSITGTHSQTGIDIGAAGTNLVSTFGGGTTLSTTTNAGVILGTNAGSTSFANLDVTTTTGNALAASSAGALTVTGTDNDFSTTTGQLLSLVGTTVGAGNLTFDTLAASGTVTGNAINVDNLDGGSLTVTGGTTIAGSLSDGINIGNGSSTNFTFAGVTDINGAATEGVELSGANGTVSFANLQVDAVGGAGLSISGNTNSVTVSGGAIGATNDSAGDALYVSGGSGAISVAASLAKNSVASTGGNLVEIIGRGAGSGTINVTGALNDTSTYASSANNSGLYIHDNTGGTFNFSDASKVLNTGANTAITMAANTGATVNISGGLDIDTSSGNGIGASVGGTLNVSAANATITTSGNGLGVSLSGVTANFTGGGLDIDTAGIGTGFGASGGGTVTITGANNSINSVSGTALSVSGTTIGAGGLTFQRIDSGNNSGLSDPVNGILLNNTGTSGGLTITGDAGSAKNGSGGTIQSTTGDGIKLTGVTNVSLDQMNIQNTFGSGIDGTDVTNFSITNSTINNSGTGGGANTSNIAFNDQVSGINNLDGTVTITGNTLTNARFHGVQIYNESGTISNLNVSTNVLTASGSAATSAGSGIAIDVNGSAGGAAAITAGTVNGNTIDDFVNGAGIQIQGGNATQSVPVTMGTYQTTPNTGPLIQIANNQIGQNSAGTPLGTNGIQFGTSGTGQGNFSVTGNQVAHFLGIGISGFGGNRANISAYVDSNTIDGSDNIATSSGMAIGSQLGGADASQTGTIRAVISNNAISGMEGNGIDAGVIASHNTGYFRIVNNTVGNPQGAGFRPGILVRSGSSVGDATVYLELTGNTSGSATGGYNNPGINVRKEGSVSTVNEFHIEGLPNNPATHAQVESYLSGLNPGSYQGLGNNGVTPSRVFSPGGQNFLPGNVDFLIAAEVPPEPHQPEEPAVVPPPTLPDDGGDTGGDNGDPTDGGEPGEATPPDEGQPTDDTPPGDDPAPAAAPDASVVFDDGFLSQAELDFFVDAARQRWTATGLTPEQAAALGSLTFRVVDMPGQWLGSFDNGAVSLDSDGAGRGWFADTTPLEDSEFANAVSATRLVATPGAPAAGRFDLLTTVMHEMGHALGLGDLYDAAARDNLLYGYLFAGERRLPGNEAQGATPGAVTQEAYAGSVIQVIPADGTGGQFNLPPGQSVDIQWDATIDPQTNQLIVNPVNSGTVTATNTLPLGAFPDVTSNVVTTALDTLTLGGTVWLDNGAGVGGIAANGIKDGTEAGIGSVALSLFVDADNNDVPDTPGTALLTTTTAGSGDYSFTGLAPGNYIVRVDATNFSGGALANRATTSGELDPDNDVDNDDNGYLSGGAVFGHTITLAYNSEPPGGIGSDTNLTLDFGFAVANRLPAFTGLDGTPAFTEGGAAVVLDANATVSDPDLTVGNYAGASLTLARSGGPDAADLFGTSGTLTFSGADVLVGATIVGTFTQSAGTLVITFNANATQALLDSALQQLTYSNTSNNPPATAVIGYAFSDGNAGSQGIGGPGIANGSVTVSITGVDDAGVAVDDPGNSTAENATVNIAVLANDSDPDSPLAVSLINGTPVSVGIPVTLTSNATVTLEANGTLTYDPAGKFNYLVSAATAGATGAVNSSAPDSFSYTLAGTGGGTATVSLTVNGVDGAGDELRGNGTDNNINDLTGVNYLDLSQGGDDIANGLDGNDRIYFGAEFDALDVLDGGDGLLDALILQGSYTLAFGETSLLGIEYVSLQSGSITRWGDTSGASYSYAVTMHQGNTAPGQRLVVNAQSLQVGETFTFDGSAETDGGRFIVYGGRDTDVLTGGSDNDIFSFEAPRWNATDTINGGSGMDAVVLSFGSGLNTITIGAGQLTGIESLSVNNRFATDPLQMPSYALILTDGNVAAGETLIVNGQSLQSGQTFEVDGSAIAAGRLRMFGGDDADLFVGGANNDQFTGGAGGDTFEFRTAASTSVALPDEILDFEIGSDTIDLGQIDAIGGGADDAFTFVGSTAFSNTAGELRAELIAGVWHVEGDLDGVGGADFAILVTATTAGSLTATDFVL